MEKRLKFEKIALWCCLTGKRGVVMKGVSQQNDEKFLVLSEEDGQLIVKGSFVTNGNNDVETFFHDLEEIIGEKVFVMFLKFPF
jgi:hypothetical protein